MADVRYASAITDPFVLQLFENANNFLTAVAARSQVDTFAGLKKIVTIHCVSEKPVLVDVSDGLGDNDTAGALQSAILDDKVAAADGSAHTVKEEDELF